MTLGYITTCCCIFLELNGDGDNVSPEEEADDEGEHITEVTIDNSSESHINGSDSESDGGVTGSIEQITVEPVNQNYEEQTCIEATTGNVGNNNNDNSDEDVDGGDGSTHEVVEEDTTDEPDNNKDVDHGDGEDNFEDGVKYGTSNEENIVETSTNNDVDSEDGSDEDTGEEENTNGDGSNGANSADAFGPDSGLQERRKRSIAKRNPRRPHRTHKHFNQKRLENGTLPYKLINVKSLKARLAQRNSNHKSWKQKRAGKFSIHRFLKECSMN